MDKKTKQIIAWVGAIIIVIAIVWVIRVKQTNDNKDSQANNQAIPGVNSGSSSATPLTSMEEIGSLTSVSNGTAQLYENNNLGISLTIPKNWILDSIYDKNVIVFKSPADAMTNYQQNRQQLQSQGIQEEEWVKNSYTLQIKYYKDFETWYNSEDKVGPENCSTVKECFQQDGDFRVEDLTINNNPAFSAISIAGDVFTGRVFAEHNGIYEFDNSTGYIGSNRTAPYDFIGVINTLKFLR